MELQRRLPPSLTVMARFHRQTRATHRVSPSSHNLAWAQSQRHRRRLPQERSTGVLTLSPQHFGCKRTATKPVTTRTSRPWCCQGSASPWPQRCCLRASASRPPLRDHQEVLRQIAWHPYATGQPRTRAATRPRLRCAVVLRGSAPRRVPGTPPCQPARRSTATPCRPTPPSPSWARQAPRLRPTTWPCSSTVTPSPGSTPMCVAWARLAVGLRPCRVPEPAAAEACRSQRLATVAEAHPCCPPADPQEPLIAAAIQRGEATRNLSVTVVNQGVNGGTVKDLVVGYSPWGHLDPSFPRTNITFNETLWGGSPNGRPDIAGVQIGINDVWQVRGGAVACDVHSRRGTVAVCAAIALHHHPHHSLPRSLPATIHTPLPLGPAHRPNPRRAVLHVPRRGGAAT